MGYEPIVTVYSLTTGLGSEVSTEPHFQDLCCIAWEREALSFGIIKGVSLDMAIGTFGGRYWRLKEWSKEMREKTKESKSERPPEPDLKLKVLSFSET